MFRPNYAQDAPPEAIRVGGASDPVNVDFRTWIDVLDLARELYPTVATLEEARSNARVLAEMQRLAFGRPLGRPSAAARRKRSLFCPAEEMSSPSTRRSSMLRMQRCSFSTLLPVLPMMRA